jgi:hypothetical protein
MLSHPLLEGLLGDERVRQVLDAAPHAYLTVGARSGPHTTPEIHLGWGGRIWSMVGRETVKAKVLRERPAAGVVVRAGDSAVVVAGEFHEIDPRRPLESLRSLPEAVLTVPAIAGLVGRNADDLAGFVEDALEGRLGAAPPSDAVLLAVRPVAVAFVAGDGVLAAEGDWPGTRSAPDRGGDDAAGTRDGADLDLPDVPGDVTTLLGEVRDCVVGWTAERGPIGIPGRWDPERRVATVPADLFGLARLDLRSPACLVFDEIEAHHPEAKHGILLRGEGAATPDGDTVDVRVEPERVTWWRGSHIETRKLG